MSKPISEYTDQELTEAWFREIGWHWSEESETWFGMHNNRQFDNGPVLPDICSSEPLFNSWVLPVMKQRGLKLRIDDEWMHWIMSPPFSESTVCIKESRRLRAAVEGALEILEYDKAHNK